MRKFVVIYTESATVLNPFTMDPVREHLPEAFLCEADDSDHAAEQCKDAEPSCVVWWVFDIGDAS